MRAKPSKRKRDARRVMVDGIEVRQLTATEIRRFKQAVQSVKPPYGNKWVLP